MTTSIVHFYRHSPPPPPAVGAELTGCDAGMPVAPISLYALAPEIFDGVLNPDVLGILLTSKCSIACRHCCNESAPGHESTRSYAESEQLLAAARAIDTLKEIGISGGEPFMYVPLLRSVVRLAVRYGYTVSVTTNGFWARSPVAAARLMAMLRSDGLAALHISTSAFHREFLDACILPQAVRAAVDAGLRPTINVVASRGHGLAEVREALGPLADAVDYVVMPCLPAGRAEHSIDNTEFVQEQQSPHGDCREDFRKLALDQQGDLYPCCSPGGFTAPLRLGNIHAARPGEAPNGLLRLLSILHEVGPGYFLPFVRAAYPQDLALARFSDKCHLCHVLLSDDRYTAVVHWAGERLFRSLETGRDPPQDQPLDKGGHIATNTT